MNCERGDVIDHQFTPCGWLRDMHSAHSFGQSGINEKEEAAYRKGPNPNRNWNLALVCLFVLFFLLPGSFVCSVAHVCNYKFWNCNAFAFAKRGKDTCLNVRCFFFVFLLLILEARDVRATNGSSAIYRVSATMYSPKKKIVYSRHVYVWVCKLCFPLFRCAPYSWECWLPAMRRWMAGQKGRHSWNDLL